MNAPTGASGAASATCLASISQRQNPHEHQSSFALDGRAQAGFSSERIRECVLVAKSWRTHGVYPELATLSGITNLLGNHLSTLWPYARSRLETLPPRSERHTVCQRALTRAERERHKGPGPGLESAVRHAHDLAGAVAELLIQAELFEVEMSLGAGGPRA
ncbi:DUF6415 family natural product biosynthesis protein [Streptomyces sp. NPDC050161]|uniref:DUF6415 family natural product biosynthesis protein n=1 Tax=Streptomyces sp. NPDC050161 TaxID=3365604 RepID=UPI00378CAFD6